MPKALIFMPFDPKHSGYVGAQVEYGEQGDMKKNKKVKEFLIRKGFSVAIEWYTGQKLPHIQSFDNGHIYIRGHGHAGEPNIYSAKAAGERMSYEKVYERLRESGLPKSFSGQIHCFSCHSGEPGDPDRDPLATITPYARMFADHLYTNGYRAATFYGYLGPLDSYPKHGSKGVNIYSRNPYSSRDAQEQEYGTWDQARVGFRPTVNHAKKKRFWLF